MTRAPQDRVTGASFDYDAIDQVAVVNGNVEMASGADRSATSDKATVDQQADTILLTGSVVAIQGRNQLKGERLFVERATGRTQLSSPGVSGEEPGRISTRFYRGEENAAQTAKDKVKQLADDAAAAAQGGAVSCSRPTRRRRSTSRLGVSMSTTAPSKPCSRATCTPCRATSSCAPRSCAPSTRAPPASPKRALPPSKKAAGRDHAHRGPRQGDRNLQERAERHGRLGRLQRQGKPGRARRRCRPHPGQERRARYRS